MALFLETAQIDEAQYANRLGFIEGITTTPALIAQTGLPPLDTLAAIIDHFQEHVFYELTAQTAEARLDEAWQAYDIRPDRIVISIPASIENLALVKRLSGVDIAITDVSTPAQAYLAAQAKAHYVMPHISQHPDSQRLIGDMAALLQGTETQILATGITSTEQALAVLQAGAHHIAVPMPLIQAMGNNRRAQDQVAR